MSKVARHTPGPWSSEYDDNGFYHIQAANRPSPYIAATGGEGEADEANARLIAAAPELLEAMKKALPHLDYQHVPDDVWFAVTAALAKAEAA